MLEKERTAIWAKVELLMDLQPSAFRRKYQFKLWEYEVHPLGMLCVLKASEDLINTAYEVFPEAANDAFTLACAYGVDLEVIKWLYNKAPEVIKSKNPRNKLPLHAAMKQGTCLRTAKFLYQSYPAALMCKDEHGCTPVHFAFWKSSLAIVKFLLGESKADVVQMENNNKDTPLHFAFFSDRHEEVPQFVATKYPDFLKKPKSSDGRLLLHVACRNAMLIVGVQVLLEHNPDAAKQKDKKGKIPLALACQNKRLKLEDLLALIELLVRVYPESVHVENNDGIKAIDQEMLSRLVMHMAKEMGQPPAKRQRN